MCSSDLVSQDLRSAVVHVTVMGTPGERATAMKGLKSAAGFLQAKVAARLQIRYTPVLSFKLDDSVKKSVEMGRLIEEAVASDARPGSEPRDRDVDPEGTPGPAGNDDDGPEDDEQAEDDDS